MGLNSILKFFQPKDRIFYSLFEDFAKDLDAMASFLKAAVMERDIYKRTELFQQIHDVEHKNDERTHLIMWELGRNFITPFDREDIHALASAMDDISDYIHSSAKKIKTYQVDPTLDTGITKQADLISEGVHYVTAAVGLLRNMKNMSELAQLIIKINNIETMADDLYDNSIKDLFANEPDAKEVLKRREIYQALETATDRCEDVANVIESIMIKYA